MFVWLFGALLVCTESCRFLLKWESSYSCLFRGNHGLLEESHFTGVYKSVCHGGRSCLAKVSFLFLFLFYVQVGVVLNVCPEGVMVCLMGVSSRVHVSLFVKGKALVWLQWVVCFVQVGVVLLVTVQRRGSLCAYNIGLSGEKFLFGYTETCCL